jgi:hypothetical protein
MPKKGYKHTEETKNKISVAQTKIQKLIHSREEYKEHQRIARAKPEYKNKMSVIMSLAMDNPETRLKLSHIQKISMNKPEVKIKSVFSKTGNKNPNWNGGSSFEPYSSDFNEPLKRYIREKYKYICQLCGKINSKHVHHIDYNKQNSNEINLINLCAKCNCKVNYRRNYYRLIFSLIKLNEKG